MKLFLAFTIAITSAVAWGQDITLGDYGNWKVNDIANLGFTKESLFQRMNRKFVRTGSSICSNRALVWVWDFERFNRVNAAKIFLFYTQKTGEVGRKTWWYHVSPMVNERGQLWVMDAGFPKFIDTPLTRDAWLTRFVGSSNCKEIKANEPELIGRMFEGRVFPERTAHGVFDCYYRITPAGYWTPASVAKNLLGVDEYGVPVQHLRDDIDEDELMQACMEASTTPITRAFGAKKSCEKYLGL